MTKPLPEQYVRLFRKSVTPKGEPVEGLPPGTTGDGASKEEVWLMAAHLVRAGYVGREETEAILGPEPPAAELAARGAALMAQTKVARPTTAPLSPAPADGVGTEFEVMVRQLGFKDAEGCLSCQSLKEKMNRLGPDGCERDFDRLVGLIRKRQANLGWVATLRAAGLAMTSGLVWVMDPADPAPGLLREAIRRARAKAVSPPPEGV